MHGGDVYRNNIHFDFSVNINPLGIPQEVQWVLTEAALHANKYPDILHERLISETASIFGVNGEQIVYGNGASEIIMAICHSVAPKKAMLVAPCFLGYSNSLKSAFPKCQIVYHYLQEDNGFELHHDIVEQILVEKPSLLFLTNPNNPNGLLIEKDLLLDIISACDKVGTILVVDECFLPLTGQEKECSLAYDISNYKSVIVLRAFTKTFSIPGVRIGYAICSKKGIADGLKAHLPEWNLSIFAQMAGAECLKHNDYVNEAVKLISREREFLIDSLTKLHLKVFESDANFILFKSRDKELVEKLLDYKILIRDCSDFEGLDRGYYRIAVKQHNENEGLLTAIQDVLF